MRIHLERKRLDGAAIAFVVIAVSIENLIRVDDVMESLKRNDRAVV